MAWSDDGPVYLYPVFHFWQMMPRTGKRILRKDFYFLSNISLHTDFSQNKWLSSTNGIKQLHFYSKICWEGQITICRLMFKCFVFSETEMQQTEYNWKGFCVFLIRFLLVCLGVVAAILWFITEGWIIVQGLCSAHIFGFVQQSKSIA